MILCFLRLARSAAAGRSGVTLRKASAQASSIRSLSHSHRFPINRLATEAPNSFNYKMTTTKTTDKIIGVSLLLRPNKHTRRRRHRRPENYTRRRVPSRSRSVPCEERTSHAAQGMIVFPAGCSLAASENGRGATTSCSRSLATPYISRPTNRICRCPKPKAAKERPCHSFAAEVANDYSAQPRVVH